jgi:hypothetical protein
MRRIIQFLLLLAAGVLIARADTPTVFFNLGDFTTAPIAYKQVRVAPAPSSFPRVEGSQVIGRDLIFKVTDASGQFYITNMVPGDYDVTFTNRFLPTTFRITVVSTTGVVNAYSLTSAGTNSPSNLAAYSQSAANARFVLRDAGHATNLSITATSTPSPSAGQVLSYGPNGIAVWSNAPAVGGISVAAGTNIHLVTNGSVITINSTATGGAGEVTTAQLLVVSNYTAAVSNLSYLGDVFATNWTDAVSNKYFLISGYFTNWTAAISNLVNTKATALTNLVTTATNGFIHSDSGKGTNTYLLTPLFDSGTNAGTLGVEGDTYIGGDLSGPQIRTINSANQIQMGDGAAALTTFLVQGQVGSLQIGNDTWRFFGTNNGGFWLQSEDMGADHPMLFFNGGRIGHATNNPQATFHVAGTYTDGSIRADGHITSQLLTTNRIVVADATGKLINASGTPTGAKFLRDDGVLAAPSGSGDMVNSVDGVAITNLANTKQHGSQILTNLSGTSAVTNVVSLSTSNATSRPITNSYTGGVLTLRGIEMGSGLTLSANASNIVPTIDYTQVASFTNATALTNLSNQKQQGDAALSNLVGTVARNVTNVVSLSTSNATSRPLTNSYTAGVLTLRGLEAGSNVTLSENASNIVISATAGSGIAVNGGGGTNNHYTNATWYEKLTAGPNTNGFFTVSNSSATAVGVLHFISTNGSGPRSIWSINLTNGDMAIAGDLALDQISAASLLVTTWFSITGPFTNSGSSYLVGPVQASSTVIATNFIPTRRVLFASTNNSAVTNILLNVTNDAALTIYSTNHLVWTNIIGLRAEIQPSFVVQVYPQFTLTNLWPSGNVHGYRIQTNDNSTLWTTFTNGNKYVISGTADGTNLVLAVTRFSQ